MEDQPISVTECSPVVRRWLESRVSVLAEGGPGRAGPFVIMSNRAKALVALAQNNEVPQSNEDGTKKVRQATQSSSPRPGPSQRLELIGEFKRPSLKSCRKRLFSSSGTSPRKENNIPSRSKPESCAARLRPWLHPNKLSIPQKTTADKLSVPQENTISDKLSIPQETTVSADKVEEWLTSTTNDLDPLLESEREAQHQSDSDKHPCNPPNITGGNPGHHDLDAYWDNLLNPPHVSEPEPTVLVISNTSSNTYEERPVETLSSLLTDTNEIVLEVQNSHPVDAPSDDNHEVELVHEEPGENVTPARKDKKVTRKRSCTPAEWKHKKAKRALNSGEEHLNPKGQLRPSKTIKPACVCRFKCFLRITEQQRLDVHNMYWKHLADKRRQWEYIYIHSPTSAKKTRTTRQESRRAFSRKYYLGILSENNVETERVQVCKLMFTNTLNIGDGVIVTAHKHSQSGCTTPDKRGKHSNRANKATEAQAENIRNHINSFPRVPSHYVRAKCQREYVQCGLSISRMAKEYKSWCNLASIPVKDRGSKHMYRHILVTEFNIGFFKPKKDQCQLCNMFKNAPRLERETVLKDKWIAHIKSKAAAYKTQKEARKLLTQRRDVAMCTFDLQKVLPCPRSETSVFFYKNKLSVYNLTVYDVRTHVGKCYVWHEGIAKRGANEIGSCVFDHIEACANDGITEIHSFSDSCSGQNRNRFVYAMLLLAAEKFSVKIRHCFLEPGHTYNEGDSVHATIEKAARRKEIFDLNEWVQLIVNAKVEEPPYVVKLLRRSDIKDFHELVLKQNWEKDTMGKKITWNKVKVVEAGFHGPGTLSIQYSYDSEKIFLNTNNRRGHPLNLKTYKLIPAYQEKIPLNEKTVKHLQELCAKKNIPEKYHPFYDQVIAGVEPEEGEDVDDPQVVDDSQDPEDVVDDNGFMEDGGQESEVEAGPDEIGSDDDAETDNYDDLFGDD